MKKISTMRTSGKNIFQGQLTIGLDLGDRSSAYCVLNEAGEIVLEHKLATTPEAMKQVFGSMPRCRIAMETGTHSPWVSRLLTALGYEVIVGHAQGECVPVSMAMRHRGILPNTCSIASGVVASLCSKTICPASFKRSTHWTDLPDPNQW